MANRRAKRPDLTKALALEILKRDDGCFWCGGKCDPSTASIEYRVPPKKPENETTSTDLACVCEICSQTEVRRVRFPKGLLNVASNNPEASFSEMVRLSLSEYVIRNKRNLEFKDGLFHGQGVWTWPDGGRYEGGFKGRWGNTEALQQYFDWVEPGFTDRPDYLISNPTGGPPIPIEAKLRFFAETPGPLSEIWAELDGTMTDELRDLITKLLADHPGNRADRRLLELALWNLVKQMHHQKERDIDA